MSVTLNETGSCTRSEIGIKQKCTDLVYHGPQYISHVSRKG
jgi:hypothetical protein